MRDDPFREAASVQPVMLQFVAEAPEGDTFVLDGLVRNDDDELGEPVALVVSRPSPAWFDLAIEHLLAEWADASESVLVHFERGRRGRVAVLERLNGATQIRLDLVRVA